MSQEQIFRLLPFAFVLVGIGQAIVLTILANIKKARSKKVNHSNSQTATHIS
jgi:hypothetical protein